MTADTPTRHPTRTDGESARILEWYALVQDIYDIAYAAPLRGVAASAPFTSLLGRAAAYFGLQELAYHRGRPPSLLEPCEMVFPLPPFTLGASESVDGAISGASDAGLPETQEHYLYARLGPRAPAAATLRPQVARFARHLERCLQISRNMAAAQSSLDAIYEALDRQDLAVVLYDLQGRPRFCNRAATGLRTRYPELRLDPHASGATHAKRQPLGSLLLRFRQDLQRGEQRILRQTTDALLLTLIPLLSHTTSATFAADGPSLGLLVQERVCGDALSKENRAALPEVPDALSRRLEARFALTPAEARLSYGLCAGLSVTKYAALSGRSTLTVRKQLKSIYRKVQVQDQKALILRIFQEQQADCIRWVRLLLASTEALASDASAWSPARASPRSQSHQPSPLLSERARPRTQVPEDDRVAR